MGASKLSTHPALDLLKSKRKLRVTRFASRMAIQSEWTASPNRSESLYDLRTLPRRRARLWAGVGRDTRQERLPRERGMAAGVPSITSAPENPLQQRPWRCRLRRG